MNNKTFIKSIIFSFVLSGVLFFSVLLPCFPVHASGSGSLPYIVPSNSDLNTFYSSSSLEAAIFYYENNIVNNVSIDSYLVYSDYGVVNGSYYAFCFIPNPSVNSAVNPSFDYLSSTINIRSNGSQIVRLLVNISTNSIDGVNNLGTGVNLLGTETTSNIGNGVYTPNYPFYMYGDDIIFTVTGEASSNVLVFTNTVPYTPDVFESGHAQEPSFDSDTIIDSSLHPNVKPIFPTFNTYNITNYTTPSIDTSTVETLLESLIDVVIYNASYVVSNIVGAIQNLWNNLGSFLEYLCDLLSYLFNRVINTIKQTADNLYQNFKDLFEPVLNSFANLINIVNTLYVLGLEDDTFNFGTLFVNLFIPSEEDLNVILSGTREYSFVSDISSFLIDWIYFVDDVISEDSIYEIHIPSFDFAGTTIPAMTVSFDWYIPIKPVIDPIISAFLIFGYGWWLFTRLAGLFHGQAPDSKVVEYLTKE